MTVPSLTRLDPPETPRALVLMLHGGRADSHQAVDRRRLAAWNRFAADGVLELLD